MCSIHVMNKGKKVEDSGIQMPGEVAIGDISDWATNILEYRNLKKIKMEKMKLIAK